MITGVIASMPAVNKMQINRMWLQSGNETPIDVRMKSINRGSISNIIPLQISRFKPPCFMVIPAVGQ